MCLTSPPSATFFFPFFFFCSDRSVLDPASYGLNGSEVFSIEGVLNLPSGQTEATLDEIR